MVSVMHQKASSWLSLLGTYNVKIIVTTCKLRMWTFHKRLKIQENDQDQRGWRV